MISLKRYGSNICLEILLVHRCNLLQRGLRIGPIQRNGAAPEQKRTEGYIIVSTQASNQKVQTGCPFVKVCKTFSHFTVEFRSNRCFNVLSMQLKRSYDIQLHYAFMTSINYPQSWVTDESVIEIQN
jgi:hypothetical protein